MYRKEYLITIKLVTTINQGEEITTTTFEEPGKLNVVGKTTYLRYHETQASERPTVIFKVIENEAIRITRRSADQTLRLPLALTKANDTAEYQLPQGNLKFTVQTKQLNIDLNLGDLVGEISAKYQLLSGDETLGSYAIKLQFTA